MWSNTHVPQAALSNPASYLLLTNEVEEQIQSVAAGSTKAEGTFRKEMSQCVNGVNASAVKVFVFLLLTMNSSRRGDDETSEGAVFDFEQ